MRRFLAAAAGSLLLLAMGAGPTTEPVPAKVPVPKNWLTITNETYHFQYRVPPKWKALQQSDTVVQFQVGGTDRVAPLMFIVEVGPCHAATTKEDAEEVRKSIPSQHPDAKIVKDASVKLGGKPAWLIEIDDMRTTIMTSQRGNEPPKERKIKHAFRVSQITHVEGELHYFVTFMGDDPVHTDNLPAIRQVLDSFAWSEVPAAK